LSAHNAPPYILQIYHAFLRYLLKKSVFILTKLHLIFKTYL